MHGAVGEGQEECVRFILACGFPVDTRNTQKATALQAAAQFGHTRVLELLLNSGANIETLDDDDCTPLMYATLWDRPEAVALLVARGAVINNGEAPISGTAYGSITALKALMTSPRWLAMSRTERLNAERKLLHYVDTKTTLDAIRSLALDMSVLVQSRSPHGDNALHFAARNGKAVPLICALIKEGVDPTTLNKAGHTPAAVASEAGHTLQTALLERAADDKRKRDLKAAAGAAAATPTATAD